MKTILITDTHFGCHNNSITWCRSQLNFFRNQLIPYIKENYPVRLIHLGDVFDSRSSISTAILKEVKDLFRDLSNEADEFTIVAGNHDYYYFNSSEYCNVRTIFSDFNIKIIDKDIEEDENFVYIPWPQIDKINENYNKPIITHCDYIQYIGKNTLYTGHIHTPYITDKIKCLGSVFALTFNDANQDRYFYTLDNGVLTPVKNEYMVRFWRINLRDYENQNIGKDDFVEIYTDPGDTDKYKDIIESITSACKNCTIIPNIISNISNDSDICDINTNIDDMISSQLPQHLKDPFERLKSEMV